MQAPMPPVGMAQSPYQPPVSKMGVKNFYSFDKWLMAGMILFVISSFFAEFPLATSAPNVADYDLTDTKEADQFVEDSDAFDATVALYGALNGLIETSALALIAYAFIRESHDDANQHIALRITLILGAVVMVSSITGRFFSIF